ncbi:LytTR family transcriptional regulator DNA-binding domain-containing protein [Pseudarcicella hirudinis]|uniref:LytTR family transcriptional regulator DNA-binding domain-containing protein n=1 Tax=Pseudarcicella hirudinis TaxID=1079859 RepID=UPI0035E6AA2D
MVYEKDGQVYKELIRSSLSRLEGQIDNPEIVRCHRSFIVNLSKVASVSGNAQGYKLKLKGYEMLVPVARKNSDIVKRL